MGGFDGMYWYMNKKNPDKLRKINSIIKKAILACEKNFTTKEKLLTAPVDSLIIIGGDTFSELPDRKPIDISQNPSFDLITYLTK